MSPSGKLNDTEIREQLKAIDEDDDVDVTSWEADFIDSIVYQYKGWLTAPQRTTAIKIIEKYQ